MFKSGKPSKPARKPGGGNALMQQMGFQVPNVNGPGEDDEDDDDDLEAELQRLQHGAGGGGRAKAKQKGAAPNLQSFHNDVSRLLHDIDRPINDDELSDVDDDDLLAELNEITEEISHDHDDDDDDEPPSSQPKSAGSILAMLQERQEMYSKALAAAKTANDTSKARRLDRQLKTIQELLQSARAGGTVNESDIPPEVFVGSQNAPATKQAPVRAPSPPRATPQAPVVQPRVTPKPQPPPAASVVSPPHPAPQNPVVFRAPPAATTTNNSDPAIEKLKALAVQAKQQGDMAKAKEYVLRLRTLQSGATPAAAAAASVQRETYDNVPEDDEPPPPPLPLKAPEPRTVMEALQQRHEELSKRGEEAASRGDSSKSRRMERLSKQYEEAIDATRKGRAYDYNELPDIPGFGPIPIPAAPAQPAAGPKPAASNPQGRPSNAAQHRVAAAAAATTSSSTTTRKNQQAQTLRLKQEKFYKLAAQAKQQGDIETAKKFLIAYKGLEQMIQAAESGLPVDMSQVPRLPDDDSELINDDDLTQDLAHADRDTIFRRLQDDLLRQIQLCARNQQIYNQMEGSDSIKHANEYKILEQRCAHDLEKLRQCFQHGAKPPLFHYERRQMNIVQVNHDLGENDLEVTVLRGINLPVPLGHSPASLETYVAIEFPYPTDAPQLARTRHVAGSDNAEYPEGQHKFYIKRQDAKFRRLMSRKELKLGVFYKPGFLRSDRPLGIASIKLAALEQTCTIHESVDLFESEHKKKIEGKLEVKLRIKEALGQTKASDILPQRWLVIDRFEEVPHSSKASSSKSSAPAISALARLVPTGEAFGQIAMNMGGRQVTNEKGESSRTNTVDLTARQQRRIHLQQPAPVPISVPVYAVPQSAQVLNYEASMLEQQIEQLRDRLSPDQLHQLKSKLRTIQEQSDRLVDSLRSGGQHAVKEHLRGLEELIDHYDQEAREFHQKRDGRKADISLAKKKLVMKEIETLTGKPVSSSSTRF